MTNHIFVGLVGIGGYLTQGGLSFLSAQHGLAVDSIVELEAVLPNGTIATINAQNNPDLLVAMRGSGDQFGLYHQLMGEDFDADQPEGIVTKFTLKTYNIGKVWGGFRIYAGTKYRETVSTAFHEFIRDNEKDPKAAIIVDHEQAGGVRFFVVFFFYDGEKPPKGVFGKFEDMKAAVDLTATRGYDELVCLAPQTKRRSLPRLT